MTTQQIENPDDIPSMCESVLRLDKEAAPAPWLPEVWMNFDEGGFAAIGPHHQPGDSDEEREDNAEPESPTGNAAKLDAKLISEYRTAAPILATEIIRLRAELEREKRKVEVAREDVSRLSDAVVDMAHRYHFAVIDLVNAHNSEDLDAISEAVKKIRAIAELIQEATKEDAALTAPSEKVIQ